MHRMDVLVVLLLIVPHLVVDCEITYIEVKYPLEVRQQRILDETSLYLSAHAHTVPVIQE